LITTLDNEKVSLASYEKGSDTAPVEFVADFAQR
jgi:hypothetical protein